MMQGDQKDIDESYIGEYEHYEQGYAPEQYQYQISHADGNSASTACEPYSLETHSNLSLPIPHIINEFGYHYDPNSHYSQPIHQRHTRSSTEYDGSLYYPEAIQQGVHSSKLKAEYLEEKSWSEVRLAKENTEQDSISRCTSSVGSALETNGSKRKKFLERNRVAGTFLNLIASKCRQKKKAWMQELETKSSEVFQRNRDLQALTNQLRDEIADLKLNLRSYTTNCSCHSLRQIITRPL